MSTWLVFVTTCDHAAAVLLPLYASTCHCVHCSSCTVEALLYMHMRHPVYHCKDNCQSVSSLDALASVPVADQRQAPSSGFDMLKHSLGIIITGSSSQACPICKDFAKYGNCRSLISARSALSMLGEVLTN